MLTHNLKYYLRFSQRPTSHRVGVYLGKGSSFYTTPTLQDTALNGTYTVLVTLPGGCTLSGTGNLTVGTPPTSTTVSGLSVGAITPTTLCAGAVVTVPFTMNGTVSAGTTFQAQLSDATGAFPTSTTTGAGLSLTSTTSPLSLTIPANALPGSGYRVRVVSSDPQTGTALSPSVLTVGGLSSLTVAVPPATTVVGNPVSLTALVTPAPPTAAYAWNGPNSFTALTTSNVLSFSVSTTALSGQYTVVATLPGGCTVSGTGNLTIGTPATNTATECDIRIVAKDAQSKETSKIPRTAPNSLSLSVENLDGTALTGYSYAWTRTVSTSAGATTTAVGNSPTLSATSIGEYKVVVSTPLGGGPTYRQGGCIAYLTLSKGLCQTVTQTYQCGTRPATPVGTPGSPVLTNLAPGDTIRTGDFDVVVTEVTGGGSGGWTGKGYTAIPYLKNQRIAVELNGAVVNDCYELMSGTVVSAYDPDWGGVKSVDAAIDQIKDLTTRLVDLYNTYTGTQAEKDKIRETNTLLCQNITTNNQFSTSLKAELQAECQAYTIDSEAFLACTAPTPTSNAIGNRTTARVATTGSCTVTAEDMAKRSENLGKKIEANATDDPAKKPTNPYLSEKGVLLKPMKFFSVVAQKVVELPADAKLDVRLFDQDIFNRYPNQIMSFQVAQVSYYAYDYAQGAVASKYIAEKSGAPYPLTPVTAALPEVFTVQYTRAECNYVTVYKTKLKADGTLDGPKELVVKLRANCGDSDSFITKYGQGLAITMANTGQQADIYLYDCTKTDKYYHITASGSQSLTGSGKTVTTGSNNVMVRGCWDNQANRWKNVETTFRTQPTINPVYAQKGGITSAAINAAADQKINQLVQNRGGETDATGGTNTEYSVPAEQGHFRYKNSNLFVMIVGLKDLTGSLIELAKVPEKTWNSADPNYSKCFVNVPGVLAGGTDQVLEEVTDGLQFVNMALEIAAEPSKAKDIWDGIKSIRPEMVKNIIQEHAAVYAAGGDKAWYQSGRDGVTLATMWKGLASFAVKAASGVQEAGATIVALLGAGRKVGDQVLGLLKKLQPKFSSEQHFMAFLQEYGRDDAVTILNQFDAGFLDVGGWEILRSLPDSKMWVRRNQALLNRMVGKTDAFKENVREYFNSHQMPSGRPSDPPFRYNDVDYDGFGHPDFVPFVPQLPDGRRIKYVPAINSPNRPNLNGSGSDISTANTWGIATFGNDFRKKANGRCEIRNQDGDWIECVWHHHEDGRTMMPVPTQVHNRSYAGAGTGAPHTGGAAVITNGIQDFFSPPNY